MSRKLFDTEVREYIKQLFENGCSPEHVTEMVNSKFTNLHVTRGQMSSQRSYLGLGPIQKTGAKRKRKSRKSVNRNYSITVNYPEGEMIKKVDHDTAMAIIQILTST